MTSTEHDVAVERVARAICADDYAASGDTEKQLWDDPDWRHVCGKMYLDFARAAIAALATTPPPEDSAEVARLREALRNIAYEAERAEGGWVHLKRAIAVAARAALEPQGKDL